MNYPQMNPRDALKAHGDLGTAFTLAHHFNTFPMDDDGYNVALNEFKAQRTRSRRGVVGAGDKRANGPNVKQSLVPRRHYSFLGISGGFMPWVPEKESGLRSSAAAAVTASNSLCSVAMVSSLAWAMSAQLSMVNSSLVYF